MTDSIAPKPLLGKRIAIPESRELSLFAAMLEERGAEVYRCPLVAIHDSPETAKVEAWLREFARGEFNDLILLTGEGLRRLLGFAERAGGTLLADFIAALGRVRKISRGPKPGNALRQVGLKPDLLAARPTTEGVIETLSGENLAGRKVAVQLYGTEPNLPLMDFLAAKGAVVSAVAPYIYADESEDAQVVALIDKLERGGVDAIAFTSQPQVKRLFQIARNGKGEDALRAALNRIHVAAVGPVVAEMIESQGVPVTVMPETSFFMKPLVRQLVLAFG
jgi:uroporphyrinogen-III synthase